LILLSIEPYSYVVIKNMKLGILHVFFALSLLWSCSASSKKMTSHGVQVDPSVAKGPSSKAPKVYTTKTFKTIIISETHPVGHSLSTIEIRTKGFEHDYSEIHEDKDPITDVFIADLDNNGFDEIYIITASAGSGSYGSVLGFASNKDKSLSMINFSENQEGDKNFEGYMGHDTFRTEDHTLVRFFSHI